jgi:hypothetical protein
MKKKGAEQKTNFTIFDVLQKIFRGLRRMVHGKSIKKCTRATRNLEKAKGNSENESEGLCHSFHYIPWPPFPFNLLKGCGQLSQPP